MVNMNLTVGLSYSIQGVLQRWMQMVIGNTLKVDLTDWPGHKQVI